VILIDWKLKLSYLILEISRFVFCRGVSIRWCKSKAANLKPTGSINYSTYSVIVTQLHYLMNWLRSYIRLTISAPRPSTIDKRSHIMLVCSSLKRDQGGTKSGSIDNKLPKQSGKHKLPSTYTLKTPEAATQDTNYTKQGITWLFLVLVTVIGYWNVS